jgi:hypothetical protein
MTTLTIALAIVIAIASAAPVMAATDHGSSASAKPVQIKHSTTMQRQHRANLQARESTALMPRSTARTNANFTNANASGGTEIKNEAMVSQLGRTVTVSGYASDPICKPGSMTPLGDGRMHPCQ